MKPTVSQLDRIVSAGVPAEALAFHGRWWQLESWLREVVYVELRAKYGADWTKHLQGQASNRAAGDEVNAYMASADAGELLAYADVTDLSRLIDDQWDLFSPLLPPKPRWQGTVDELRDLRNRSAHCRRPHRDDLSRIEQVLRDLDEGGAWTFYATYLDTHAAQCDKDSLVRDWVEGRHLDASRLLKHAERQYDVRFRLAHSRRPWAESRDQGVMSGTAGVLWHATWIVGGRDISITELWSHLNRHKSVGDLLVHLVVDPGTITATFSAVDDPADIADAIGNIFDEICMNSRPHIPTQSAEDWSSRWLNGIETLPLRVQAMSPLTLVDPAHPGLFSIFSAD